MSEPHDDAASEEVPATGRNWKKVAIIGGGAGGALLLIVGVVVTVVMMTRPAEDPKKTAAQAEHVIEPATHEAAHAASEPLAHTETVASASHSESSKVIAAPHAEGDSDLQAQILALQEEKRTLLQEQVELLKQQKAMMQQGVPVSPSSKALSGDKNCQLSGNPTTRTEELRNCFGLVAKKTPVADAHAVTKPEASKETHVAAHDPGHWEYSGEAGPEYWGKLKPEFATCGKGQTQSPINIVGEGQAGAPRLEFNYKPSDLRLINNGHTIQVNYAAGSQILVDGQPYDLLQFHFHTPSEELINGRAFDMVIHLVHKNKAGQLAVVGVLLKQGAEQVGLSPIWPNLPASAGPEQIFPTVKVDANKLLPVDKKHYFAFAGSLTTPPCSEGVRWFVMKNPITLSATQFKRFTDIYSYNARPVQPLYKRVITQN